jgi:hypothetical protein
MPDREPHGFDAAVLIALIVLATVLAILLARSLT